MKRQTGFVSLVLGILLVSLWAFNARATVFNANLKTLSTGDPSAVVCSNFGPNGYCNSSGPVFVSCPKTGTLPYVGLGATCTKYVAPSTGDYVYITYQMTATYAETAVINAKGQWGGYFWIQTDEGGDSSDSCGNAPGFNYYGISYNWCLNAVKGYYWITLSSGVYGQNADEEDWATNMLTPPEGTG